MAEISKITLPNGDSYDLKDSAVPSWAKAESKPTYTASEVDAVPTTRTVNGKALSSDITLTASDVSALPSNTSIPSKTSDLNNDAGFITSTATSVTIAAADWSNNTAIKTVNGVTANNTVIVTYAPASKDDYTAADIYCSAQAANSLTFVCTTTPTEAIIVNILIIEEGA